MQWWETFQFNFQGPSQPFPDFIAFKLLQKWCLSLPDWNFEILTEKMDLWSDLCSDLWSDLWSDLSSDLCSDPWSDPWFDLWSDLRCDLHLDLWNIVQDTFRTLKNINYTPEIHRDPSSRMPLMLLVSIRILLFSIWHFQFNLRVCPRRQFQTLLCFSGLLPLSAEPEGRQP